MKSLVKQWLKSPIKLSPEMWGRFTESPTCAPYLVSCFGNPNVLYVSPQYKVITGYDDTRFKLEGARFWFSIIHPADMQNVISRISKAEHDLIGATVPPTGPLELEYRIKRVDGTLCWIRDLKLIISWREGAKDHILCALHDITSEKAKERSKINQLLKNERETHGLLETALSFDLESGSAKSNPASDSSNLISPREKDVLRLVAAGSSSKQIADQLSISENTVETHRRNLLKKLQVNNSTALVKEALRLALI